MKLETRLTRLLGKEKVFTSLPMWEMYAYDSSPFISKPDMVVFVSCTDDVSHVMGLAYEYGVPVLARGAGTCLSGGAVPVKAGISLVMARMNAILSIDPVSRTALVEPGIVNLTLQKALAPNNLIFPPDPASQKVATIGGNVSECAGGIQGAKYVVTKNYGGRYRGHPIFSLKLLKNNLHNNFLFSISLERPFRLSHLPAMPPLIKTRLLRRQTGKQCACRSYDRELRH